VPDLLGWNDFDGRTTPQLLPWIKEQRATTWRGGKDEAFKNGLGLEWYCVGLGKLRRIKERRDSKLVLGELVGAWSFAVAVPGSGSATPQFLLEIMLSKANLRLKFLVQGPVYHCTDFR
jgi:hypothetical protein